MQNKKNGFSTLEFIIVLIIMGLIIIMTTYGTYLIKKSRKKIDQNIEKTENIKN